jgi:hypothetical protein
LAVTSVVRHAGPEETSAFLRIVDFGEGRVLATAAVPESAHRADDPNPRGGLRGARGASFHGDRFVVANSNRLFVMDQDWRLVRELSHPLMSAVHDVLADEDGIWITSSNLDLLMKLSWDGELLDTWTWRHDPKLVRTLGFRGVPTLDETRDYRDPRTLRSGVHNIVHLNAVTRGDEGLIVSFGRIIPPGTVRRRSVGARLRRVAGAFRSLDPPAAPGTRGEVSQVAGSSSAILLLSHGGDRRLRDGARAELLFQSGPIRVPNHNALQIGDLLVYNDSNVNSLVAFDRRAREVAREVALPGDDGFARGLLHLGDGRFLVGSQSPAAVHVADLGAGKVVSSIDLGGQPHETVYAVARVPEGFADPAEERLAARAFRAAV